MDCWNADILLQGVGSYPVRLTVVTVKRVNRELLCSKRQFGGSGQCVHVKHYGFPAWHSFIGIQVVILLSADKYIPDIEPN